MQRIKIYKRTCPHCHANVPFWKVYWGRRILCPKCGSRLGVTLDSARRAGKVGGILLAITLTPVFLYGLYRFPSLLGIWQFWLILFLYTLVLGSVVRCFVTELVPYDQAQAEYKNFKLF